MDFYHELYGIGIFGVFAFTDDYFEIFVCNAEFDF